MIRTSPGRSSGRCARGPTSRTSAYDPEERQAIEHACAQLVNRYANLNDAGQWDSLIELFVEDARMSRPSAPDDWIKGREAIRAAFRSRPARMSRHLWTNIVIDAVDAREARGECALALFMPDQPVKIGSFTDRFVKTDQGWKFAERRGSLLF
ncbi:MAG TPA: nuclear transport factor 2 family protein [Sphingomonas sp.]|nr:nuclear transport factor 2 family protein [Sphingomonas sp.]